MLGDPAQARQHWTQALALYTSIGDPEAANVQARLTEPEPAPPGQAQVGGPPELMGQVAPIVTRRCCAAG
jgi:hypothetical protein